MFGIDQSQNAQSRLENPTSRDSSRSAPDKKTPVFTAAFLAASTVYFCFAFLNCVYSERSPNIYENMVVFGAVQYDFAVSRGEIWRFLTYPLINDSYVSFFLITVFFYRSSKAFEGFAGGWVTATVFMLGSALTSVVSTYGLGLTAVQYSALGGSAVLMAAGLSYRLCLKGFDACRTACIRVAAFVAIHIFFLFSTLQRLGDIDFEIAIPIGALIGIGFYYLRRDPNLYSTYSRLAAPLTTISACIALFGIVEVYTFRQEVAAGYRQFQMALDAFKTNSFADADKRLAEIRPAVGLSSEELALWRYVAQRRAGKPSADEQLSAVKAGLRGTWERDVADVIEGGRITTYPPVDATQEGRNYAWYYFVGETFLLEHNKYKALEYFKYVRANAPRQSPEHKAAEGELSNYRPSDAI